MPYMGNPMPPGIAMRNEVLRGYKNGAKDRNLKWEISDEYAFELFKGNCHYCGVPPYQVRVARPRKYCNGDFIYNGIDRKHNNLGYIEGNCVSCCFTCNDEKKARGYKEFLDHKKRQAEELLRKGLISIFGISNTQDLTFLDD
jgi:5-methylcytosine-specific restriction endonuclease McrA